MKAIVITLAVMLVVLAIAGCAVDKFKMSMEKGTIQYPNLQQIPAP